jgi:pimeloyl-ACP methyl ester carboxylesterase
MHGYAGSGALFFKIIKRLSEEFCLILIDIVGMGGSSRPPNFDKNKFTPQQALDYFLNYIEAWRIAIGDLTDFFLAGHSFGGYITGHYALKYK